MSESTASASKSPATPVRIGSVIAVPLRSGVRVLRVLALPDRSGPPGEARACYEELGPHPGGTDVDGETART